MPIEYTSTNTKNEIATPHSIKKLNVMNVQAMNVQKRQEGHSHNKYAGYLIYLRVVIIIFLFLCTDSTLLSCKKRVQSLKAFLLSKFHSSLKIYSCEGYTKHECEYIIHTIPT